MLVAVLGNTSAHLNVDVFAVDSHSGSVLVLMLPKQFLVKKLDYAVRLSLLCTHVEIDNLLKERIYKKKTYLARNIA